MNKVLVSAVALFVSVGVNAIARTGPAPASAVPQDAALVAKGQKVYDAQKCSLCHAVAGKGNKTNPLDGVGGKLTADDIRQWILKPVEMTAKAKSTKKPPMTAKYDKLPAADIDALVAYIQSLK